MSGSNSLNSFLDEDKYNSERLLALKYIKERIERASTVQNILAPITPQDEYIFDYPRDDASEVSELSDPFAELGKNIVLSVENKQKRRLSKVEADVLVMNSFPPTHMEIQNELAAEVELEKPPQLDVEKIMQAKFESSDEESEVAFSLDQVGLKAYKEEKKKADEREKLRGTRPKKVKSQEEEDVNSLLSGIWRLLDATSTDVDGFPITQPGYNFYDDKKTAMVKPGEKTWNQKEEVRKKCEDWLKEVK